MKVHQNIQQGDIVDLLEPLGLSFVKAYQLVYEFWDEVDQTSFHVDIDTTLVQLVERLADRNYERGIKFGLYHKELSQAKVEEKDSLPSYRLL